MSPRNSLDDNTALLEDAGCATIVTTTSLLAVESKFPSKLSMAYIQMPEIGHWLRLQDEDESPYPYNKSFEEAKCDPFVAVHTSGSTGSPRIVTLAHGTQTALDAYQMIPAYQARRGISGFLRGTRLFMPFPLFHCAAIGLVLGTNIFMGVTTVFPSGGPLTAELAGRMHIHGRVQGTCLPPSILSDVTKDPALLRNLLGLRYISYGGGPLSREIGNQLSSKGAALVDFFGSSETNLLPSEVPDPEDWEYHKFCSHLGYEFRRFGDGLYELVIRRNESLKPFQGVFFAFPELQEYPMKDLFSKHPTKPDLWLYEGRADDVIVFSNGEKFNPARMEKIISTHPAVKSTLVVGHGRSQAALLVELVDGQTSRYGDNTDLIWPVLQEANARSSSQGRLAKDLVMYTVPGKPMLKTSKGTVQRKNTLYLYREETNKLYSAFASAESCRDSTISISIDPTDASSLLNGLIVNMLGVEELDNHRNMFETGLDSVQVITLAKQLNSAFSKPGKEGRAVSPKTIYANPSVRMLASFLNVQGAANEVNYESYADDRTAKMKETFSRYSQLLPFAGQPCAIHRPDRPMVVLLTGSSGSLGSYLLDVMIKKPNIHRVFCVNRSMTGEHRQLQAHISRSLSTDFSKVEFITWDISKSGLGIVSTNYGMLLHNVTHIVHNAWEVNFNLTLECFSHHINGVRQLIDLASKSSKNAQIFFLSTISAMMNSNNLSHDNRIPEAESDDWNDPEDNGYAESKYVAERLLATACRQTGIQTTICRIGQIAGPIHGHGIWPRREWLPSLIASSKYLGMLPSSLGPLNTVDWIPVDAAAQIIVELLPNQLVSPNSQPGGSANRDPMKGEDETEPMVYHVINPCTRTWPDLLPTVRSNLGITESPLVSLTSWIDALHRSLHTSTDASEVNPAVKLIPFFEKLHMQLRTAKNKPLIFHTEETARRSVTMARLGPVTNEWMELWMRQWGMEVGRPRG